MFRHPCARALAIALVWCPAAVAQQSTGRVDRSWDSVVAMVRPGAGVAVTLRDRQRIVGTARAVDGTALTLLVPDSTTRVIPVADVARVERTGVRGHRAWKYGVPLGFLIGGVAGLIDDGGRYHTPRGGGTPFRNSPIEVFGMTGAFIGAPVGALVAALLPVGPPLYEAGPTTMALQVRMRATVPLR